MSRLVIDAFAGPGGWDLAARELGLDVLGIEWDDAACQTRAAAGLRTLKANVAALDPRDFAPVWGFIASAPCPAFSMAGKGEGRAAISEYQAAMGQMAEGLPVDWSAIDAVSSNESGHLILEPLRWVLALRPRWVALEQVEPVVPLWESMADHLRGIGYSAWCGICSAETFGVPQTRRRAILLASLDGPVGEPPATHQRYIAPRRRDEATGSLFEAPEPERIVLASERHLLPWVSMAEALGWADGRSVEVALQRGAGMVERHGERPARRGDEPAPAIRAGTKGSGTNLLKTDITEAHDGRVPTGRDIPTGLRGDLRGVQDRDAGESLRRRDLSELPPTAAPDDSATKPRDLAHWAFRAGTNDHDARRYLDEPAPTLRFGGRLNDVSWVHERPTALRSGQSVAGEGRAERSTDAPALTIIARSDLCEWVTEHPTHLDRRQQSDGVPKELVPVTAPAPTVRGASNRDIWVTERPATTVQGEDRIARPGHKGDKKTEPNAIRQMEGAVRVSLEEAATLQSFPPGYPWAGTKTKRFEQVGNAVPPLMAKAILSSIPAVSFLNSERAA